MSLSEVLFRVTLAASAVGGLAGLAAWRQHGAGWTRRAWTGLAVILAALATAAFAVRWREAGHLPLFGTFESALSLATVTLWAALALEVRGRLATGLSAAAALIAAALMAHGLAFDPTPYALTISERSWVVDVHAVLAWAAFGLLTANAAAGTRELWRDGAGGRALAWTLEWGFWLHTAMMVSGSLYKFLLFGRAWSFDPIETLGLIAWVAYATLLHLHLFAGWRGRRLAAACLALFVVLVVTYRGIVYFPAWSTYHIFDMDLRQHVVR